MFRLSIKKNIAHVELIDISYWSLLVFLFSKVSSARTILWVRGYELEYRSDSFQNRFLRSLVFRLYCIYSDKVIFKEPRQLRILKELNQLSSISYSLVTNYTNDKDRTQLKRNHQELKLLYMNRVVEERNLMPLLDGLALFDKSFSISLSIIGFNGSESLTSYEKRLKDRIKSLCTNYEINCETYTTDPEKYLSSHNYFVFPAKHTYANHSLIEALSYGLIPLIRKSEWDYKLMPPLMQSFGLSSVINDSTSWSNIFKLLYNLSDEERKELSDAAIDHQLKNFSRENARKITLTQYISI